GACSARCHERKRSGRSRLPLHESNTGSVSVWHDQVYLGELVGKLPNNTAPRGREGEKHERGDLEHVWPPFGWLSYQKSNESLLLSRGLRLGTVALSRRDSRGCSRFGR